MKSCIRKRLRRVVSLRGSFGRRISDRPARDAKVAAGALRRCLGLLDGNQQRCVVFAFVDGLSHAEMAARLPAPLGTVKSWVRRG